MLLKRLFDLINKVIFPPACILCGDKTNTPFDLCSCCAAILPIMQQCCPQCANPLQGQNDPLLLCGQCLRDPPPFNRTIALFHYQYPINRLLTALKFQGKLAHARLLGQLMSKHLQAHYPDLTCLPECIIPIPLHHKRLRERGFNQALELARPIAKHFKLAINLSHCQRIKSTTPQTLIPAKMRRKNVRNAFHAQPLTEKHVAIIDDVITTGHTAIEISKALRKVGVEKIDLWCCARTNPGTK